MKRIPGMCEALCLIPDTPKRVSETKRVSDAMAQGTQREKERTGIKGGDRKLDQKRAEKAGENRESALLTEEKADTQFYPAPEAQMP